MDKSSRAMMRFISGYEIEGSPQSVDDIKGDFQLAGLITSLNRVISNSPKSLIIDVGCGNGTLFSKLLDTDCFKKHHELAYIGFDFEAWLPKAFENATKLNLLSKVRLLPLDNNWATYMKEPCVVVIRNVLHELLLSEVSELIYNLCTNLPNNSTVFLQDMSTLPVAEKGRCGWMGIHIESILQECGIYTVLTPDTSKSGVDIYLIEGKRKEACKKTKKDIEALLLDAREKQLSILHSKYEQLKEGAENALPILRITHDITAISFQMGSIKGFQNDDDIISSTFLLAFKTLSMSDFNALRSNFKYPQITWFQNRGHAIQAIDEFLVSDKTIFFVKGPQYIGKKTAVWHSLNKKKHSRMPLFIDLFTGITIFNILEELSAQLGIARFLDVEILSALKTYPTKKLFLTVKEIVSTIAMNTILILDSLESIIDPSSELNNEDVKELINQWSSVDGAKIIIESRTSTNELPSEKSIQEHVAIFKSREDSPKFGKLLYSVQLLQEIVPNEYRIADYEYGGFPYELLVALDNHPYFLYVAGTAIRNNPDTKCLNDPTFLTDLIIRLSDALFSNFNLDEYEKELIYALTLIQDGFPLSLLDIVSGSSSLSIKLLEKGLILEVAPGVYKVLGILKYINVEVRKKYNDKSRKWNKIFHDAFRQLYNITSNPTYYRQAHYHAILGGEKIESSAYNVAEISKCTETWYRSKHLKDTLWGCREIKKHRKLTAKESMWEASCIMRRESIDDGRKAYDKLIGEYPYWKGLRGSLIDSQIATGERAEDALKQLSCTNEKDKDYYQFRQAARCYRQLGKKAKAYEEFGKAILQAPNVHADKIISELILYAKKNKDTDVVEEWQKYRTNILKTSE